ncbi:MAG: molybdopterin-binding protein [Pseudomonadota bacterium]|nr:molybdopterin-binding protein [Pseudomonadota bacterium]
MTNSVSENVAIVIIGDEILSGRTRDTNFNFISKKLLKFGILVSECRIISDNKNEIISTVNELRKKYKYVITTGGIGPTHDDITSESIADAFGVKLEINKDAYNILSSYYKKIGTNFNEVRQRMAKIPSGAKLIKNQISAAPGFKIENVFVLAGVPKIMESMLNEAIEYMEPKEKAINIRLKVMAPEGEIANILEKTIENYSDVKIGSYPFFETDKIFGVNLELNSHNDNSINNAISFLKIQLSEESINYK